MSDVFISYSRRDGAFIRKLHERLVRDERDVWVDWEDIPATADWWDEIKAAIEAADAFAFVITPNSVRSDVCRDEIQHAIDNNKRFIPLLLQEVDDIDAPFVHSAIRSHNWIPFEAEAQFDVSYQKLLDSLSTEPEYLRRHTRLLVRAKEWQANERQASYLLKGAELREFQQWLAMSQTRTPKPTEVQFDYILASQTAQSKAQRRLAFGAFFATLLFAVLVGFALLQQEQLDAQNAQRTIDAQEGAFIRATSDARGTRIAAQETRISGVQVNATNIVVQANAQNTQAALQNLILDLQETIDAFNVVTGAGVDSSDETQIAQIQVTEFAITETAAMVAMQTQDTMTIVEATPTAMSIAAEATPTWSGSDDDGEERTAIPPTQVPTRTDLPITDGVTRTLISYVVQDGDFAVDIAARFNTTIQDIADANGINNTSVIFVGQVLLVPYELDLGTETTFYVDAELGNDGNDCRFEDTPCSTINGALAQVNNFAEIQIAAGVYQEQLTITQDVVLVGSGIENTLLTGDFANRVITIEPDTEAVLIGLTVTGGSAAWGGGILNRGDLNLINTRISGNVGELSGAGVANFSTLSATFTEFVENYAPYNVDIYSAPETMMQFEDVSYAPETAIGDGSSERMMVNTIVRVSSTEGDRLNLRSEPTTESSEILLVLERGIPLLVIGGPVEADGFIWWEVQTTDGMVGWAVEWDEEQTLTAITEQ